MFIVLSILLWFFKVTEYNGIFH